MASRSSQRRVTAARKDRQREARRIQEMRERLMGYEYMSAARVARMSVQELEQRIKVGGRRRIVSPFDGIALALAWTTRAAAYAGMLTEQRRALRRIMEPSVRNGFDRKPTQQSDNGC